MIEDAVDPEHSSAKLSLTAATVVDAPLTVITTLLMTAVEEESVRPSDDKMALSVNTKLIDSKLVATE
jgi:hypothetical protein